MPERYRTEYDGEFVITTNQIIDGKKHQEREWIDNPIENQHISGRAAVIGNGQSRYNTNFHGKLNLKTKIELHKGWHLGRKRLQSYGAEDCWQEMQCDFYIEFDKQKLAELKAEKYQQSTIVYSHARNCIDDPGEYYLVPYGVRGKSVTVATWLACFDGHKEIFLLGVDALTAQDEPDEKLIKQINLVFETYRTTQFYYVSDGAKAHDMWRKNANFNHMNYGEFISYCDI
jgi:hypothetical protein